MLHAQKARSRAEEEYLLSTKLFCGKCKRMMAGESGKRRDEAVYRYYKCSGVKRKLGCDKKTVRKSWIEDIVVEEIKRLVHDNEAVAYIADCVMKIQGRENPILPCLREQLAEVEKGIGNLVNAIQMGICNDATKKRMDELEARKSEHCEDFTVRSTISLNTTCNPCEVDDIHGCAVMALIFRAAFYPASREKA